MATNFFDLFQLPQQFDLDVDNLAARHKAVIARVHPDQYAHKSAVEQRMALQMATLANEAFDTLKSPILRAQYLLGLHAPEWVGNDARRVVLPPEFLMQQMVWREALESGNTASVYKEAHALANSIVLELGRACTQQQWPQVAQWIAQAQFVANFMNQIERAPQ